MSLNSSSEIHPALTLGEALPNIDNAAGSGHLFVSLSELILEQVFYHPAFQQASEKLDDVELTSIDAILGEQELKSHFVSKLCDSILGAIKPEHNAIRVSLSSADSYAFSSLLGGKVEVAEVNPALGLRGVSRFASETYTHAFALECEVIKVLKQQGHDIEIVVPFVRALADAAKVIDLLAEQGLPRGLNGLKVLFTVDVPSSALLAERLLHYFDGVVINLENLAQFTLGIDHLNESLDYLFDPQSEAVLSLVRATVNAATQSNKPVLLTSNGLAHYSRLQEYLVENQHVQVVVTG